MEDPSTHDVTFKTSDGGSVSAHWVIVVAGSPGFHAMLCGSMKESSQKDIELPSIKDTRDTTLYYHLFSSGKAKYWSAYLISTLCASQYLVIRNETY